MPICLEVSVLIVVLVLIIVLIIVLDIVLDIVCDRLVYIRSTVGANPTMGWLRKGEPTKLRVLVRLPRVYLVS